jgi:replication fork clamp-binding protein CrfC
LRLNHTPEGS